MKIAILGDIALVGRYDLTRNKGCFSRLETVREYLSQFDYVIGNLESPLTDVKKTWVPKSMHLRSPRENVQVLKYLGVNAVSIANNHTYDFGRIGLEQTIETLDNSNIDWCGSNGKFIRIRAKDGSCVNVSAFCCASTNGVHLGDASVGKEFIHLLSKNNVQMQLEADSKDGAYSLMINHWGQEHTFYPSLDTVKIGRKILGMKENVAIVAHHPHQIQGFEKVENNLVAYSLGNFIFDDCESLNGKMVLKQNFNNKKTYLLVLEINENKLISYSVQGFVDDDSQGLMPFDIDSEIKEISKKIVECESKEYQNLRLSQIRQVTMQKFGKHDLEWLLARLNYHSIGAKLLTYKNQKLLQNSVNDFVGA